MIPEPKPQPEFQPELQPGLLSHAELQRQLRQQRYVDGQNFSMGFLAGLTAATVGACVWATITYFTGYQIGWMGIGLGYMVGNAVRASGKGIEQKFGLLGAALALLGCLLGNLLAECAPIAAYEGVSYWTVLGWMDPAFAMRILETTFHPIHLLFYVLAIWAGYRYAYERF